MRRAPAPEQRDGERGGDERDVVGDELLVVHRLERAPRHELLIEENERQHGERERREHARVVPVEPAAFQANDERDDDDERAGFKRAPKVGRVRAHERLHHVYRRGAM